MKKLSGKREPIKVGGNLSLLGKANSAVGSGANNFC